LPKLNVNGQSEHAAGSYLALNNNVHHQPAAFKVAVSFGDRMQNPIKQSHLYFVRNPAFESSAFPKAAPEASTEKSVQTHFDFDSLPYEEGDDHA
jgi:hypothetical protein